MTLIGKAKEDFLIKVYYQEDTNQASDESIKEELFYHSQKWIERQDKRLINQLIIDFFDSVNIPITLYTNWNNDEFGSQIKNYDFCYFKTRKEAIEKAIEKANEVYNHRYS